MDFVMVLPRTPLGHEVVLVIVDRLTNLVHFIPIESRMHLGEDGRHLCPKESETSWCANGDCVRQRSAVCKRFLVNST